MLNTSNDNSYGIIPVFRTDNGSHLFLLVRHKAGHWAFPKGHSVEGESVLETIKRELYEETGATDCNIVNNTSFKETYSFERGNERINKTVTYLLGFIKDKNIAQPENFKEEISETRFVNYEKALELITYDESKNLLKKVRDYLENLKTKE